MKPIYRILLSVLGICGVIACVKAPNGFLSAQIRYRDTPIQVSRGTVDQTIAVDDDGSSAPVTYTLLDIRDAITHKHADSLYKNRDRYIYISPFDPNVDTSVALLNSTRKIVSSPSFTFNSHTGGFTFYGTTAEVPASLYEFDIQASNEHGIKTYKNIADFNLYDGPVASPMDAYGAAFNDTTGGVEGSISIKPTITITKISPTGTLAILKIVDKNGTPFNPKNKEYIPRGVTRSDFNTFAKFHPLLLSDTAMTCNFEVLPFPFQGAAQGFYIYYRIPSKFVKIESGVPGQYRTRGYSVNPRFEFQVAQQGSYLITIQIPNVVRDILSPPVP